MHFTPDRPTLSDLLVGTAATLCVLLLSTWLALNLLTSLPARVPPGLVLTATTDGVRLAGSMALILLYLTSFYSNFRLRTPALKTPPFMWAGTALTEYVLNITPIHTQGMLALLTAVTLALVFAVTLAFRAALRQAR